VTTVPNDSTPTSGVDALATTGTDFPMGKTIAVGAAAVALGAGAVAAGQIRSKRGGDDAEPTTD
jgi:hypothetical protein